MAIASTHRFGSHIMHVGSGDDDGNLSFQVNGPGRMRWAWAAGVLGEFVAPIDVRSVVHGVIDFSAADEADRVRMYHQAGRLPIARPDVPDQDATISVGSDVLFVIGNREDATRTAEGTLFYVAVYDVAFDEQRILAHTQVLVESDDQ